MLPSTGFTTYPTDEERPESFFAFKGHFGDIDLVKAAIESAPPSVTDVQQSEEFWYHKNRILATPSQQLLPTLQVRATSAASGRGDFSLISDDRQVRAAVKKYASAVQEGDTEVVAKLEEAFLNVSIDVYSLAKARDALYKNFQAGEEADQKKLELTNNLLSSKRFKKFAAVKDLLRNEGKICEAKDIDRLLRFGNFLSEAGCSKMWEKLEHDKEEEEEKQEEEEEEEEIEDAEEVPNLETEEEEIEDAEEVPVAETPIPINLDWTMPKEEEEEIEDIEDAEEVLVAETPILTNRDDWWMMESR